MPSVRFKDSRSLCQAKFLRRPASRGHSTSEQPIAALQNLVRSIVPVTPPGSSRRSGGGKKLSRPFVGKPYVCRR
ncbi:hypothetical protein MATL_G00263760 [Megalops atlanticus]|uniref:Uncharacterized protein n=1 Tax=Megalops atlanticus TaxID=7932 RepID=A0A9D3SZ05_MEGAT|nr:hypothetical protein MATL_G00263760 [Megalops atlanticus]